MGLTELVIYDFGVFTSIIGGALINVFLRVCLTFFDKNRVLIFTHERRVRSMFFEFLEIVEG